MIYLQLLLLLAIFYQDLKERQVYLLVMLVTLVLSAYTYYDQTNAEAFYINIGCNIAVISGIIAILYAYTTFKMKLPFLQAISLGDLLFFLIFSVSFATLSFLILFSISFLFTGLLFMFLKKGMRQKTVPLAGFQAIFLFIILFINLMCNFVNLYAI